jgi:tripartite-type tricarboxylate transporter receptor subunit TctC
MRSLSRRQPMWTADARRTSKPCQYPSAVRWLLASLTTLILTAATAARAEYPEKPIQLIVPFGPGGPADILARVVGLRLSERLGKQVVIENQSGASTIVGTQRAAQSRPDGYTLVVFSLTHAANAASDRRLPYDSLKDFTPVAMLGASPFMLIVNPQMPSTLDGLLARARTDGPLVVSTAGVGSSTHLTAELFGLMSRTAISAVPYRGSGPALVDLMSGVVQASFSSVVSALPYTKNGRLRGLAVTSLHRSSAAPDLPTLAESGFAGFDSTSWIAVFAPAGTPAPIVNRLNGEISAVLDLPDVRKVLENDGSDVLKMRPGEVETYFAAEVTKWHAVITKGHIKFE